MKKLKGTNVISSLIVAVIVFGFSLATGGIKEAEGAQEIVRYLCDAFTAPGVVLVGAGALSWASTKGAYDVFGYGLKVIWSWLPFTGTNMDGVTYYDYAKEKQENRVGWRADMLIVGGVCLAVALILLIVYYLI